MSINVRSGGLWKPSTPHVRSGGLWKQVQEGYVRSGGVWRKFYTHIVVETMTVGTFTSGITYYGYSASSGWGAMTRTSLNGGTIRGFNWARWGTLPPYVWRIDLSVAGMNTPLPTTLTFNINGVNFPLVLSSTAEPVWYRYEITQAQFDALPKSGTAAIIFPNI